MSPACRPANVQWADYRPWRGAFEKALDPRFCAIEHLDARISGDSARIFACAEAALIVELRHYPTGAYDGHVLIAAGDPKQVVATLRPRAEAWLRSIGALGALVESRPGWARLLKEHGYEPHQMTLRKDFARWT
ncbi:MAG: hypothetical protein QOH81_965 [Sphingomonadales bacterium]|jgi:hypothetical protein|nr:hypothetical protein [Sphingomonadales bacterium]